MADDSMVSIGIHIGQDSVCFTELSLGRAGPRLDSFDEHFFEDQSSKKDKIFFISRHLEKIEQKHKGKALRFCYGLSQSFVTSFLVHFPFKEKFKILKTLPYEVEAQSPFNPENVFFDARTCKIEEENKSSALCFVTPSENVNEFLKLSAKLNKAPYLLSCEGSALANLLEVWSKPLSQIQNPMPYSVYIYLGTQNSQILFYKEGHLAHVSVLDWAVVDIVKKMEQMYKLTVEKAWVEFLEKSFILTEAKGWTKEQVFFSNLIKRQINLLIPKLKLLKMSLETEQKIQIKEAVVFGPGSVIKNLTAFLTAELSINISRLKTLTGFPHFEWNKQPSALIALGLALEGLKSSPYKGLNFLQSMKKDDFSLFPKKWQRAGLVFLLCFVVFTAYAFIRKRESYEVLGKMESIFVNYGKRIAFQQESQISTESLKSFLEKEKVKTNNEQLVKDKLNLPNPMDSLQIITQKLGEASKWNLKIHYLKLENRTVEMRGLVDSSSLKNFKFQLKDLAKGDIKEISSQGKDLDHLKDQNLLKGENKGDLKSPIKPEESKPNELQKEGDLNLIKEQELKPLEVESDLEQKKQSFFSYSFKLKERF